MRNPRIEAAIKHLSSHGFAVPRDVVESMLLAIQNMPDRAYEVGDFVNYYEGMGESWFGTVTKIEKNLYHIDGWSPDNDQVPLKRKVTHSDMRMLSSPEEALSYYKDRNNIK